MRLKIAVMLLLGFLLAASPSVFVAQTFSSVPDWQTAAGGKMAFEVATIRPSVPGTFSPPSFALSSDDAFIPNADRFTADFPLSVYISFAYKLWLTGEQEHAMLASQPKWVSTTHYTIHAQTDHPVTKDQMRLMVQSLLADRFKLAVHFETQDTAVLGMTLEHAGVPGPRLRPHTGEAACDAPHERFKKDPKTMTLDEVPFTCNFMLLPRPGNEMLLGARNATLQMIANSLPQLGKLGRPVVDQTGLTGRYDFSLEWSPEPTATAAPATEAPGDVLGVTFMEALKEQLGVKLKATRAPLQVLVIDHIEEPSDN